MRVRRLLAGTGLCALVAGAATGGWVSRPLPPGMLAAGAAPGLVLLDRAGQELRSTRAADGSRRRQVPLAEVDPDLIAAFLAVEDHRFHRHGGIDGRAVARAAWVNLRAGRIVAGGSTITMQLARLLRPVPRTGTGKVRQALWALRLERHLSKHAILEHYLNQVPLGQGASGVEAAAALYFGASAEQLSLGQAALLAGLARSPSSDNPLLAPARAARRRAVVLRRLAAVGYASQPAVERALAEPVGAPWRAPPFLAPHFTTRVVSWLERGPGASGGTWRTSLDLGLQQELEAEIRHTVSVMAPRGARHAAAVVLENGTGEVLAWVGSPDFWADTAGQVDMVISPRQPGSALKPFLYALAFDRGYTPATILPDLAKVYQTSTGPYAPRNYDRRFHGPVRAREALGSSYNLPAVELAERLGVSGLLGVLRKAGFASLGRSAEFYGLGLALGNGDVTLLELANGYRALAGGGVWRPYRWRAAEPAEALEPGRRIASERSAALVLDILADGDARIPGFGLATPLDLPFEVAAKTGTSRHFTDNWAVGAAGRFTVAVWVGNFSGRPMDGVSGVTGAGPLLHRAVLATARRYPPGVLPSPASAGAVTTRICRLSGLLAGDRCPGTDEWFDPAGVPDARCDWHGSAGVALPPEYAEWSELSDPLPRVVVARTGAPGGAVSDDAASGGLRIVSPLDGDVYRVPPGADPRYSTLALRASERGVRWLVDGRPHASARWVLRSGTHRFRAMGPTGEAVEATIRVE